MRRLSNIFIMIVLLLFAYWAFGRLIKPAVLINTNPNVLILAISLLLIDLFIKFLGKERIFLMTRRKMLWSLCIIIIGLLLYYTMRLHIRNFIYRQAIEVINRIYSDTRLYDTTKWLGVKSQQDPTDNWIMQEIIYEIKPDFIVETGTANGGTALFYATVLEKANPNGKVITVDIRPEVEEASKFKTFQERVEIITGDSVSAKVIDEINKRVKNYKVLVTLDFLHTKEHVLRELNLYSSFVSLNSYIVVQDTYWSERRNSVVFVEGGGPREATEEFLKNNKNFKIDRSKERYLITQYPSGFLKRVQ